MTSNTSDMPGASRPTTDRLRSGISRAAWKYTEPPGTAEDANVWDEGFRYRPGPFPCERCGHRADMHEHFNGVRRCRACDYIALRFPCSSETLRAEKTLDALTFDVDEDAES